MIKQKYFLYEHSKQTPVILHSYQPWSILQAFFANVDVFLFSDPNKNYRRKRENRPRKREKSLQVK